MPLEQVAVDQGSVHSALPNWSPATCKVPAQGDLGATTSHEVSVLEVSLFKPWEDESLRLQVTEPESCGVCSVIRANLSPDGTALVLKAPGYRLCEQNLGQNWSLKV